MGAASSANQVLTGERRARCGAGCDPWMAGVVVLVLIVREKA